MSTELEARLRETLSSLVEDVEPSPGAYRRVQRTWRRRERRRRILVVVLSTLIIGVADAIGIWALNAGPERTPIVYDAPAPVAPAPER